MYLAWLRQGFGGVLRFSGRDALAPFWSYVGTVFGAAMAGCFVVFFAMFGQIFTRMQAFAQQHPDQVTVEQGPGYYSMQVDGYHPELLPEFSGLIVVMGLITAAFVVLIAAAVARRLHDSNLPGWLGAIPLVPLASGLWMMAGFFADLKRGGEPDFSHFMLIFANNFVYIVCLVGLVFLLVRKSTKGDNRYGPPPA